MSKTAKRKHPRQNQQILDEVRRMIKRSDFSQRQVEEIAGFSRGYLSQLLAQNLDLKVYHLVAILHIFDEHPSDFFARACPYEETPESLRRFAAGSAPIDDDLAASFERLYRVGIESLGRLRRRVERCERAMVELEEHGYLTGDAVD